jgi:hypothetical protein
MNEINAWWFTGATVLVLALYEVLLALRQLVQPQAVARSAHASLRETWFQAVSQQTGSEILTVQTLRNSVMSATMTASTAALALIGTVTLTAPTLGTAFDHTLHLREFSPRLALELMLMALLVASLVESVMAVRYYNHVGFIGGMPVGSPARQQWSLAGAVYVRRAGLLYSWGLRHLILVAPILAATVYFPAGPVAATVLLFAMHKLDKPIAPTARG